MQRKVQEMVTNGKTSPADADRAKDIQCLKTHDTVDMVEELADRMELSDEPGSSRNGKRSEREVWRHACLTKAGYQAVPVYTMPVKEDKQEKPSVDDLFGDDDGDDLYS